MFGNVMFKDFLQISGFTVILLVLQVVSIFANEDAPMNNAVEESSRKQKGISLIYFQLLTCCATKRQQGQAPLCQYLTKDHVFFKGLYG